LLDTPTIASKALGLSASTIFKLQNKHGDPARVVRMAAVVRLRPLEDIPNPKSAVAATVDCNSRYVYLDPYEGAKGSSSRSGA
jgi:phosphoribosylformylglycinamidine synthase